MLGRLLRGRPKSDALGRPVLDARNTAFDAADVHWVSIDASEFFFEPYCAEFRPPGAGQLIIVCGVNPTRHRGVEVSLHDDVASVWVPTGARTFWLPAIGEGDNRDEPWEGRLQVFDHESGVLSAPAE
jgi:hypothetical protein